MSERTCGISQHQLAEVAFGEPGAQPGIEAHLASCPGCRQALARFRAARGVLGEAVPPPQPAEARRQAIAAALRAARSAGPEPTRARWRALMAGAALAATAAGVFLFSRPAAPPAAPGWAVLVSGELGEGALSVGSGQALTGNGAFEVPGGREAELRLSDGTQIRASAGTRFAARPGRGTRFALQSGQLDFSVMPQPADAPFELETGEAVVRVIGTRFRVTRSRTPLGASFTVVTVEQGIVEVRSLATGRVARLTVGESITVPPPDAPAADGLAAPAPDAGTAPSAVEPRQPVRRPPPTLAEIRARIRAGRLSEARSLIARARAGAPGIDPAELAVVEAEATLSEGRRRAAIDAYLAVVRRFPSTPQAEESLFAAGSLAVDHAGREQGLTLLKQYLATYPRGRFTADVKRLLKALEGPAR
ncbi:MAG: FecR domain-containing protein [Myxococcaceae bacterium]